MLTSEELIYLKKKAAEARRLTIEMIRKVGVGHIGGALSIIELLTVLYFKKMNIRPKEPKWPDRDRFVLSKGHAGPALYAILALKGYFDVSELFTLNTPETNLPSHCDMLRTVGVDMTTGSLGQGLSVAVGMALAGKLDKKNYTVYCLIGDGESDEGMIWEAAMYAGHCKLDNLIAFTDYNKLQIDGTTDEINTLEPIEDRWRSFGFNVKRVNGHDMLAISTAIDEVKAEKGRPAMIILDTIKAKGYRGLEGKVESHNAPVIFDRIEDVLIEDEL